MQLQLKGFSWHEEEQRIDDGGFGWTRQKNVDHYAIVLVQDSRFEKEEGVSDLNKKIYHLNSFENWGQVKSMQGTPFTK